MLLTRRMMNEGRCEASLHGPAKSPFEAEQSLGLRLYHMSDYIDLDGDTLSLDVSAADLIGTQDVVEPLEDNISMDAEAGGTLLTVSNDGIEDVQPSSHLPNCTCGEDAPVAGIISGVHGCPANPVSPPLRLLPRVCLTVQVPHATRSSRRQRRARFLTLSP